MQGEVYGRGRLNREPMGDDLDYRWERWAHLQGDRAGALAASVATPSRWEVNRAARGEVIGAFIERISEMGLKTAARETGVDRAAIQRLRTRRTADVKGPTLELMRAFLARTTAEGAA